MTQPVDPTRPGAPPRHIWGPRTSRVTYHEADLTFCIQVYRDHERAAWCLENLRGCYPQARVVVISDGDEDPRHASLTHRFDVELVYGERLFPVRHGGRLVARMLDVFLQKPSRWLFKIDPDTGFYRPFRPLPGDADLFGDWARIEARCLQGGCIGMSLEAARKVHGSGLLHDPILRDARRSWALDLDGSLNSACVKRAEEQGLVSFDFVMAWCGRQLDLHVEQFLDIRSEWTFRPSNPGDVFAVVHPIKNMQLRP